ncbi:MAG: ABC transporter permease subunit [Longicatena sp.]
MNILKYECKKSIVSSLTWAISLTFFGFICIQLYIAFSANVTFFETMLKAYSPEMLKVLGANITIIKTLTGFYSFCFMYVVVAAAFQALYLGIHVLGKELSEKTADFLFTKPCSRKRVLTYKLGAMLLCLILVNVIYCGGTLLSAYLTGIEFNLTLFLFMNLSMFLTQILFLSLGFLLACSMHKIKSPLSISAGIIAFFFLLQMIVNLEPEGILSYFSFLNYLSADAIITNNGFDYMKLGLLCCISIGCIIAGYYIFEHRDIQSV